MDFNAELNEALEAFREARLDKKSESELATGKKQRAGRNLAKGN
jgi:hypothetical protein